MFGDRLFKLLQTVLGLFFLATGVIKLFDLSAFTQDVANYQLVSRPWDAVVAYFVPWLEVFVGLALMLHYRSQAALFLFLGAMAGFTGGIISAMVRGLNINCGCFGSQAEPTNYPLHLTFNVILIVIAGGLLWRQIQKKKGRSFSGRR